MLQRHYALIPSWDEMSVLGFNLVYSPFSLWQEDARPTDIQDHMTPVCQINHNDRSSRPPKWVLERAVDSMTVDMYRGRLPQGTVAHLFVQREDGIYEIAGLDDPQ